MSFHEKRKDEIIGQFCEEFLKELRITKQYEDEFKAPKKVLMPYGYPIRVYCPLHIPEWKKVK